MSLPHYDAHEDGKTSAFGFAPPPVESLTPVHIAILQWAERRTHGHERPEIAGLSPFKIDEIVAGLVSAGLINAVAVPRRPTANVVAHWEPSTLTLAGRKALWEYRRLQRLAHRPWWDGIRKLFARAT